MHACMSSLTTKAAKAPSIAGSIGLFTVLARSYYHCMGGSTQHRHYCRTGSIRNYLSKNGCI
uniref:Uncharacterized protein n=1 Tax=Aegilops tauschii subsp. strangulata TaxID=200361 RepID=A0A453IS25_AEGTS